MAHRIIREAAFEQTTAAASVATAGVAWVGVLQDWLQIIALVVSIVAGGLAIYSHVRRRNSKDI